MSSHEAEPSGHADEFYVRYYAGHAGRLGPEFMEFELYPNGKLQVANRSSCKHDSMIRKEVFVGPAVVDEVKRIIQESLITQVDDSKWKVATADGSRQELECKIGKHHLAFTACEIESLVDIQKSSDPEGLKTFYYLTQDLKALFLALISCHFKDRPI